MSDTQARTKVTFPFTIEIPEALVRLLPDGSGTKQDAEVLTRYLALFEDRREEGVDVPHWRERLGPGMGWEKDDLVLLRRVPAVTPEDEVMWVKIS